MLTLRLTKRKNPSEIDILVLYTRAAAARQAGGQASMRAEVEKLFGETNRAFSNSDVSLPRVQRMVAGDRVTKKAKTLLTRSRSPDGARSMDILTTCTALRSELGADLVHLLVAFTPTESSDDGSFHVWHRVAQTSVHAAPQRSASRSWTTARVSYTFTHELGHNLGPSLTIATSTIRTSRRAAGRHTCPMRTVTAMPRTFSPVGGGRVLEYRDGVLQALQ